MIRALRSLLRHDRGAVTIELAIAAPILATMLIGLVDISTGYSAKLRAEQIAQRTIEKVQAIGFDASDETELEDEAEAAATAGGLAGATADITYWLECDGTPAGNFAATCAEGAVYAKYVQLEIQYTFAPIIAHRFNSSNSDGTLTVQGVAGIRIQ